MKTSLTLLFFCLFILHTSSAQINSVNLEHNNVSAFISDEGTFFYDFSAQNSGYEVPKGSGRHAIHSAEFWFAAKDASNEIHFTQGSDVFKGPISAPGTYDTPEYQNKWGNSVWKICQEEIDQYKAIWECNQDPNCDDNISISNESIMRIINWPAHGDVSLGQSFYLAPFYDNPGESGSGDGIYDPSQGDYPLIKGCCAVYTIQNDAAGLSSTSADSLGIELHMMFYQYRTWDYLNDVTFVDITAFNRSTTDYPEFVQSIVVDADIGNPTDDSFGCDSLNGTMFFYNADNNDEDDGSNPGYGINPPAIGLVSLNENMTSGVPFTLSNPSVSDKWNLMKGFQSSGNPWLDPNSNETKYVFSGNPTVPSEWSAISTGYSFSDVRGISSSDYGAFNSGDIFKQSYAIIYARDGDYLNNVQSIIDKAPVVKSFYENESDIPCTEGTWNLEELNHNEITLFPNPSSGIVGLNDPDKTLQSLTVYNVQGKIVIHRSNLPSGIIEIDLSDEVGGIYFVKLQTQKETSVRKIVIN